MEDLLVQGCYLIINLMCQTMINAEPESLPKINRLSLHSSLLNKRLNFS